MDSLLRQRRHELDLSQEDCARAAGVSLGAWRTWERGEVCPNVLRYPGIARALGVSVDRVQDAVRQIERHILRSRGAA